MFFMDQFLSGIKPQFDDDIIDRLNYFYTPTIIVVMALTLSAKQWLSQPIQCWVPAQFTGAWEQYAENYCFVQNTYFLPLEEEFPRAGAERGEREIGYYQWVPFVLALQAILFYLPCLLWRLLNWQSGITVAGIVASARDVGNMAEDTRKGNVKVVAAHIQDSLELQREMKTDGRWMGWLFYGKHYGTYVTGLYLFTKCLYFLNVVCQFFILNSFIGSAYTFWGFEILRDLAHGREWEESGHFPRVTMCDFMVRVLGNIHNWTIQCVLMINMFNEKIFLFLWWWFFLVAIVTFFNFLSWLINLVVKRNQHSFVLRYLRISDKLQETSADRRRLGRFVNEFLRSDGVFLLRIISANAGDLLCNEVVDELWHHYQKTWSRLGLEAKEEAKEAKDAKAPLLADDGFVETDSSPLDSSPRSHL